MAAINDIQYGAAASLLGSALAIAEFSDLETQRANLAESRLMEKDAIIRAQAEELSRVREICSRYPSPLVADRIAKILDG